MIKYSRQQIISLYKSLPEELKNAINSEHTLEIIEKISKEYSLSEKQHTCLVDSLGQVLMGLLMPKEFPKALEQENIKKEDAKEIQMTVHRFIFYPVRRSLNSLYQTDIREINNNKTETMKTPVKNTPTKKDTYRESIEEEKA